MPRYEVFGRRGSGEPMHHVGVVDAPNIELGLTQARQCFSRRDEADEIWLVDYSAIRRFKKSEMPQGLDKSYREIQSYADLGRRRRLVEANVPDPRMADASISSSGPDLPAQA
ncbi:MAG: phenylacetic acid degradation protein PaaB [Candidatus Dormibacteria bacterium]